MHVKGKSEQKGEESTNHTSYSVLRDRMGGIYLSDERLYAVVNFIEKINICVFFYTYIRAGLSLLGLEVPAQKLTRLEHW